MVDLLLDWRSKVPGEPIRILVAALVVAVSTHATVGSLPSCIVCVALAECFHQVASVSSATIATGRGTPRSSPWSESCCSNCQARWTVCWPPTLACPPGIASSSFAALAEETFGESLLGVSVAQ